jgi:hypothetical protein
VLSFWGLGAKENNRAPLALIPGCVQELYFKDAVDDDTLVVFGDGRASTVGAILGGELPPEEEADQGALQQVELARQMHTAGSDKKRDIMKQLGVGGGGSDKPDPWNDALRRLPQDRGGLAPGQRAWRMSSENKNDDLEKALDDAEFFHGPTRPDS